MTPTAKKKLTLSIDKEVIKKAKLASKEKHASLSNLVEGFLAFFSSPTVYCFKCGALFESDKVELCSKCGWMICPDCNVCRCSLDEKTAVAIFYMRRVYEDLLNGRVK